MNEDFPMKSLEQVAKEQNYYPIHLSEVNRKNNVTATEDIYTEQGLLVAPKGTSIDTATAERILQFRLVQPLVELVRLERAMTHRELNDDFSAMLESLPDAKELHAASGLRKTLSRLLDAEWIDPVLMQELTLLRDRIPGHFRKTLLCTWLSLLIAMELGLDDADGGEVFLAGLSHDIGFLHISPEILQGDAALDPPKWRAVQSHVILGSHLLKKIYGDGSTAAKAVLEHHERCDGSGYPLGKTDDQLDGIGQITAIADVMQAIRINRLDARGRTLKDLLPLLFMNSGRHRREIRDAACSILTRFGRSSSPSGPPADAGISIDRLVSLETGLQEAALLLRELEVSGPETAAPAGGRIPKITKPVKTMIASTGLASEEIIGWLKSLRDEPSGPPLADLAELELMQGELRWQMEWICRTIEQELWKGDNSGPPAAQLSDTAEKIAGCLSRLGR
jgi:HD-GYP domain-containing protein (c-di-GMP phosphodiesterase class II)